MKTRVLAELTAMLRREREILRSGRAEYRGLREGNLVIRKKGKHIVFSERTGGAEVGISKNKKLIRELSRKRFLKNAISHTEKVCEVLQTAIGHIKLISDMRETGNIRELQEAYYSDRVLKWLTTAQDKNPIAPESLKYKTDSGISVRSKSERTIADKLFQYGIPFKYDTRLSLGNKSVYPDFIIMRWDEKIVIWEHFGLMNDPDYASHAVQKIMAYQRYGYTTHTNLICTFEKDVENTDVLDDIIRRFIL